MSTKKELQDLHNKLDKSRHKLKAAKERGDQAMIENFSQTIQGLEKQIDAIKSQKQRQLGSKSASIAKLPFNRPLTKAEQADLGALKKKVKGVVVVHPMTAIGREMGITVVTGFATKRF